mmetsp:Transcript_19323/g.30431  ORF Transcript_19323/g.30431 Transcript_19323/m.30431 type:complete len:339 (+) Transcript_19323:156-1172(+)
MITLLESVRHVCQAGLQILLSIPRMVLQNGRPGPAPLVLPRRPHAAGGDPRGRVVQKRRLVQRLLAEVVRQLHGPLVRRARLQEPQQERVGRRQREPELQQRRDPRLLVHDVLPRVRAVRVVGQVLQVRRVDVLVLRGDQEGRHAQQLEGLPRDRRRRGVRQHPVHHLHGQVQRLRAQPVLLVARQVQLHQPVHQDGPHLLRHVRLPAPRPASQRARARHHLPLQLERPPEDVRGVLVQCQRLPLRVRIQRQRLRRRRQTAQGPRLRRRQQAAVVAAGAGRRREVQVLHHVHHGRNRLLRHPLLVEGQNVGLLQGAGIKAPVLSTRDVWQLQVWSSLH